MLNMKDEQKKIISFCVSFAVCDQWLILAWFFVGAAEKSDNKLSCYYYIHHYYCCFSKIFLHWALCICRVSQTIKH